VSLVSQVFYVDGAHVALSYQFFNKPRQNVLATRRATALAIDPQTIVRYRLALDYVRTEVDGPLMDRLARDTGGARFDAAAGSIRNAYLKISAEQ